MKIIHIVIYNVKIFHEPHLISICNKKIKFNESGYVFDITDKNILLHNKSFAFCNICENNRENLIFL